MSAKDHLGNPIRAIEWNNPWNKRCYKCRRLGDSANYKAGPMVCNEETGQLERMWICKPECKPPRADYFFGKRADTTLEPELICRGKDAPEYAQVTKADKRMLGPLKKRKKK